MFDIPVIGITGSVGKTSAKEMVSAVLGEKYRVHKTPENLNNEIGVPLTLLSLDERHDAAVVEMGISEFGEMSRLAEMVRPNICVMTKIGYSHLETLGDLDGVLRAKSEVFAYMVSNGIAVVNGDDEYLRKFDPGIKKITFGIGKENDFRAENVRAMGTGSVTCDIVHGAGRFAAKIPAFGGHLTLAALSAAAVGRLLGMTDAEICKGLLSYKAVGGRANVTDTGFVTLINDSYNANPDSVKAALASLSALTGRRVAILGDMLELGAQSDALHFNIGAIAGRSGIDVLLCRGDKASFIRDGYISAGGEKAEHYGTNAELMAGMPSALKKGDNVLVKASHGMRFFEIAEFLETL
jgi:UDP-N-acetylmuramoyl-tripeptide--D-alanyl-D-alanine ligase